MGLETTTGQLRAMDKKEHEQIMERLNKIENGYLDMSRTVIKLESTVEGFGKLVDRFENVLERMTVTLGDLNVTIVKINSKVEDNAIDIKEIEKRVTSVDDKISVVDNKGKIDFVSMIRDNLGKFLFGGGLIAIVLFFVEHIIDIYFGVGK